MTRTVYETATLIIDNFDTRLRLTTGPWKPGKPHQRINVLGEPGTWWERAAGGPVPYFRAAADAELARFGYRRAGNWVDDSGWWGHVAPIVPIGQ